jgi:tRNA(Leu) C34 or U34 (ribose-2'-O)-methylase TrmL
VSAARGFFGVAVWKPKTEVNVGTLWRSANVFGAANRPHGTRIVALEVVAGARNLVDFGHPEQAVYLLGPEDGSLSADILRHCDHTVIIPGDHCLNLAVAGSIAIYDRIAKGVERSRRNAPLECVA